MKLLSCITALLLFAAALSGCTGTSATAPQQTASDDEQQPAAARTAYAKVKSIYGNELTVVFADEQQRSSSRPAQGGEGSVPAPEGQAATGEQSSRGQRQRPSDGSSGAPSGEAAGEQRGSRPSAPSGEGFPSGDFPSGSMPSGGPPSDDTPSGDIPSGDAPSSGQGRQQSTGQLSSLSFTGDEVVYLIAPSVTVTSGSGQSAQVIRFTQLSEKAVVQLSFDEQDNLTAIAVLQ